jgi:anti-sigma-K factor RskA
MPSQDSDDRLLDALRGNPVDPIDAADAEELDALAALGATARAHNAAEYADIEVPNDLWTDLADALDLSPVPTVATPTFGRRSATLAPWLAAAAVVALLAGITGWWIGRSDTPSGTPVASADLEALTAEGSATAELVDRDGELVLEVAIDGVSAGDGYLEVWLVDPGITQLVSLGPVRSDGRYILPEGLNPAEVPVVDVSVEPFDGSPAHSGNSLFRGSLDL